MCQSILWALADDCVQSPSVTLDDYSNAVWSQTISPTPGWYESMYEMAEPLPRRYNLYLYRNGTSCHNQHGLRHRRRNTINNLSACPFKWTENEEDGRVPRRLMYAVCLCNSPRVHIGHSNSHVCQSIVQFVTVFRKYGCEYRKEFEAVPVACVAVTNPQANPAHFTRIVTGQ